MTMCEIQYTKQSVNKGGILYFDKKVYKNLRNLIKILLDKLVLNTYIIYRLVA